jgi:branched-chain amino acid transport system ATP-binding protein
MLRIRDLSSGYGSVQVLRGLSLDLAAGEVLGLLGRNGAGKTTALKTIMGLVKATAGSIELDGADLRNLPAHQVPKRGLAYVPQGRRLFGEMSVAENLRIGCMVRGTGQDTLDRILELFPILTERMGQRAGNLSGGEQQMLAVARALCLKPKVLLMDEPTEGLMPSMVDTILETVNLLKSRGVAVLLVEQKVEAALRIADRIAFLEHGGIQATMTPEALHADPAPLQRYIGVGLRQAT